MNTEQVGPSEALRRIMACGYCGRDAVNKSDGHVTVSVERYSDDHQLCGQGRMRFCNYVHAAAFFGEKGRLSQLEGR